MHNHFPNYPQTTIHPADFIDVTGSTVPTEGTDLRTIVDRLGTSMQIETYLIPTGAKITHDIGAGVGTGEVSFMRAVNGYCNYYR